MYKIFIVILYIRNLFIIKFSFELIDNSVLLIKNENLIIL